MKYNYDDFILVILEYVQYPKELLCKEQLYLDTYQPEYNILKIAGSSLGHKHGLEVREIYKNAAKNRIISEETKKALSEFRSTRRGELNSFYKKKHTAETIALIREKVLSRSKYLGPKVSVTVTDTLNSSMINYDTIKEAAEALGAKSGTIASRKMRNSKNLFKNRYRIIFNTSNVVLK